MLRLWFGFSQRIDRSTYLLHGAALMALKLAVDVLAVFLVTARLWTPLDYLSPVLSTKGFLLARPEWLLTAMAVWTLPFLWIGISMSLRRALDAGLSPWIALLFFVPYVNWGLLCTLALLPSRPRAPQTQAAAGTRSLKAALLGVAVGILIGAISLGLHVLLLHRYSAAVFLGTPFAMGAAAGWFYNRGWLKAPAKTAIVGALAILVAALALLTLAVEGLFCIGLALPLVVPIGMLGAIAGRAMRAEHLSTRAAFAIAFAVPASAGLEKSVSQAPVREVVTTVEIAARPEKVWPHVIGFPDLAPPTEWFFRSGIAYPVRASIAGTGVGAVRRCEFSTGTFVEPITAWDPPRRLGFDVSSDPPSMREWSPYGDLHPPHLVGTMRSRRGEFRLIELPGGRTLLQGSTWYQLEMGPQAYWSIWAD
ncbi:MAG TPA: DUF805 domain-containing protein, partial [Myxococcales bacterium]|nr:DUF805 domain-containing protein [Myxococcales bacterium]